MTGLSSAGKSGLTFFPVTIGRVMLNLAMTKAVPVSGSSVLVPKPDPGPLNAQESPFWGI